MRAHFPLQPQAFLSQPPLHPVQLGRLKADLFADAVQLLAPELQLRLQRLLADAQHLSQGIELQQLRRADVATPTRAVHLPAQRLGLSGRRALQLFPRLAQAHFIKLEAVAHRLLHLRQHQLLSLLGLFLPASSLQAAAQAFHQGHRIRAGLREAAPVP